MTARQKPEALAPFVKGARKTESDQGPPLASGHQDLTEKYELQQLWDAQFTEGEDDDIFAANEPQIDVILEDDEAADRELTDERAPQIISTENDYADEDDLGRNATD